MGSFLRSVLLFSPFFFFFLRSSELCHPELRLMRTYFPKAWTKLKLIGQNLYSYFWCNYSYFQDTIICISICLTRSLLLAFNGVPEEDLNNVFFLVHKPYF